MRWVFCGLLAGAVGVLISDMQRFLEENGVLWPLSAQAAAEISDPFVPPAVMTGSTPTQSSDPRDFTLADRAELRIPIAFSLAADGTLVAQGSIDQGSAGRLEAALVRLESKVRTISLNSLGGSLEDAMRMAQLIRARGIATSVKDGAICASSCPLLMAGGTVRQAGDKAAIGLHQFYAAGTASADPVQAMADAQITTARISRHLTAMGVDPAIWLHALDTPPQALYYLTPQELAGYRLVNAAPVVATESLSRAR